MMKCLLIALLGLSPVLASDFDLFDSENLSENPTFERTINDNTPIDELLARLDIPRDNNFFDTDLNAEISPDDNENSQLPCFQTQEVITWNPGPMIILSQLRQFRVTNPVRGSYDQVDETLKELHSTEFKLFWCLVKAKRFTEAVNFQKKFKLSISNTISSVSHSNFKKILASESPDTLEIIDFLMKHYVMIFFTKFIENDKTFTVASQIVIDHLIEKYPENVQLMSKIYMASLFKPEIKLEDSFLFESDTRRYHWFIEVIEDNFSCYIAKDLCKSFKLKFLSKAPNINFYMYHGLSPLADAIDSSDYDSIETILSRADAVDVVLFPYCNFCSPTAKPIGNFFEKGHFNAYVRNRTLKLFLNIVDKPYKAGQFSVVKSILDAYIDNLTGDNRWAASMIEEKIGNLMHTHMRKHHFTVCAREFSIALRVLHSKLLNNIKIAPIRRSLRRIRNLS